MKIKNKFIVPLFGIAMAVCGCSDGDAPEPVVENDDTKSLGFEILTIPNTPTIELSAEEKVVNDSLNSFAFKFLNAAAINYNDVYPDKDGNYTVSPLSASICMALIAEGLDEANRAQVANTLGNTSPELLGSTCNKLMRYLSRNNEGEQVELANSVWYQKGFKVLDSYVKSVNDIYYSEVVGVDMADKATVDLVNKWCDIKTHGLIDRILDEPCGYEVLVANALYFSASFSEPFSKKNTRTMQFNGSEKDSDVPIMTQQTLQYYAVTDRFQAMTLPLFGRLSIAFLLPEGDLTADELSATLSYDEWKAIRYTSKHLDIRLPKFNIEASGHITRLMAKFGFPAAANLSGMGIDRNCAIDVNQKTTMELDETGVKGAAVTWGGMSTSSGDNQVKPTYHPFYVVRPFVFIVYDERSETVLMAGRIDNL